jgi:hypothetical protein
VVIRPRPVHLVDEEEDGEVETAALAPDCFGLGLDAAHPVDHQDGAVEDAHGALHLDGEVHMAGGIDDLEQVALPGGLGDGGGDSDAVPLLLGHVVHVGGAVMDLANFVGSAGVKQYPFRQGRLAGVHMSGDTNVANVRERRGLRHRNP